MSTLPKEIQETIERVAELEAVYLDGFDNEFKTGYILASRVWAERVLQLREALDAILKEVMLPHQITHDELIYSANTAVSIIQKTTQALDEWLKGKP